MSGFFDDSHVTEVGLQGSAGPEVGFMDMVSQGYRQQYRVDSQMALDTELHNRWKDSLRALEAAGGGKFFLPADPLTYRGYAQYVNGEPITVFPSAVRGDTSEARTNPYEVRNAELVPNARPEDNLRDIIQANEAIKKLNNPNIKSFEAILEEVARMQQGVEEESSSMYERTGKLGALGSLLGAIGGSFTMRDPLNVITAPIGAGRTIATRIGVDMGIAGVVTAATEYGDVAPNRALVDLPERDSLFNVAAATLGAGIIRGGIEGIGAGVRAIRDRASPVTDFDLNDSQLAQMFGANSSNPTVRAGARALDDAVFVEKNNPYGDGPAAQERFLAELRQVQRVMGGEPMTAVARVLPPVPFEYIKKSADFELVKEQAPLVYAKMEAAQMKVASFKVSKDSVNLDEFMVQGNERFLLYTARSGETADIHLIIGPDGKTEIAVNANAKNKSNQFGVGEVRKVSEALKEKYPEITSFFGERETGAGIGRTQVVAARRAANTEYQAAYRAVEDEAARIRTKQDAIEAAQQRQGVNIFADATHGRPFNWSTLQYDNVAARVDAINEASDRIDERAVGMFARQAEEATPREAWQTDEGIDIGLKQPVDPEFRFATDDGDMSIAAAMRDLQDDADLDEAMRTCLI